MDAHEYTASLRAMEHTQDPCQIFPQEVRMNIFSYLDDKSLRNAQAVSKTWSRTASSPYTWQLAFEREFCPPYPQGTDESSVVKMGSPGTGPVGELEKDWKKMYQIRKGVDNNWRTGSASAVYLTGHTDMVYCVQFDHEKILTGSRDRTIRVWDAKSYACLFVLGQVNVGSAPFPFAAIPRVPPTGLARHPTSAMYPSTWPAPPEQITRGHNGSVLCLQFDATMLVSGSTDRTTIVWQVDHAARHYKAHLKFAHHKGAVLDVALSAKYVVSSSTDTTIHVRDREYLHQFRTLEGHVDAVQAIQLRGETLVSVSEDGLTRLWDLTSAQCVREFAAPGNGPACLDLSPTGHTIFTSSDDSIIHELRSISGQEARALAGHGAPVSSLYLDWARGRLISGSDDGSVKVWDVATGQMTVDLPGWTTAGIFAAKTDWRRIVAASQDGRVVVMDFGANVEGIGVMGEGGTWVDIFAAMDRTGVGNPAARRDAVH